jgi:hypothetical protein
MTIVTRGVFFMSMTKMKSLEWAQLPAVTESAAGTYTEEEVLVPASKVESYVMAVWEVDFELPANVDALADSDIMQCVLCKNPQGDMPDFGSTDVIAKVKQVFKITTTGATEYDAIKRIKFARPYYIAKQKLYFGAKTTGSAAAKTYKGRIGYTMKKVSKEDFIDALVEG